MSRKFSDYKNSQFDKLVENNKQYIDNFINNNEQQFNHVNNLINQYSNMDQNQIFNQFIYMVEQKKRDGTLSIEYFNNIKSQLFPYLTDEQKQTFNNLMNYIR